MAKAIMILVSCLVVGMVCGQPIDLKGVRVVADRGAWGSAVAVPELVDGKVETSWNSGVMDLRVSPANVFMTFEKPVIVGALELETVVSKDALRVTDFEVYGRSGKQWALLGNLEKQTETVQRLALKSLETDCLRIRIRDNMREGHAWAIVAELRLFAPAAGTVAAPAVAGPVADETAGERNFVTAALGELPTYPRATFDPQKGYLFYVKSFVDTMLKDGTDQYGAVQSPMFVSILMLADGKHPQSVIPSMPGQRIGDRALFGGNLQHDLPLLLAMEPLGKMLKNAGYGQAASAYLRFFLNNCTHSKTGLWPWGEHGHWDFFKEAFGHTTHEYLGAPPLDFLEVAWQMNPKAVVGEADGMLNHVRDFETYHFCRHADIEEPLVEPRQADRKGLDFPRHGAMFLRHWAFTYSKTKDPKYLQYVDGMLKHFELTRQKDGTIPILSQFSDRPALGPNYGTNLAVGMCLLEAAPLLGDTPSGQQARKMGQELMEVVAAAPFKAPKAAFSMAYGGGEFAGIDALLRVGAYRLTKDARLLDQPRAFGEAYAAVEQTPQDGHIRAEAYGIMVNLYLDLAEVDQDPKWLPLAERYARLGIEDLYHEGLFRGASNLSYYDSELYVSTFVYALVRLQARLEGGKEKVDPLYFHR